MVLLAGCPVAQLLSLIAHNLNLSFSPSFGSYSIQRSAPKLSAHSIQHNLVTKLIDCAWSSIRGPESKPALYSLGHGLQKKTSSPTQPTTFGERSISLRSSLPMIRSAWMAGADLPPTAVGKQNLLRDAIAVISDLRHIHNDLLRPQV
ncbi:hypothetical protein HYPSUDRAFT_777855 [Hypholoma sublateritium FD-334 SS-4]|uniref:Uncharacterized protein n=1 Tax=Hypholoma sublateritium (strain FD-334 SS-4) TaxID=945553 RepID=A0A0D2L292_HYPSF|nr:hypothetical protein HYPSUDRAFT_777855 [Hypholoma sublateritium FD-334 SS-4]